MQCCVISGESGAGKTETAKFLVEQMLTLCKGTGTLEERIVQVYRPHTSPPIRRLAGQPTVGGVR